MAAPKKQATPVQKQPVSAKKALLAQAMAGINKKFGAGAVGTLKEKADEFKIVRIQSRSAAFNQMLYGGWVGGRISELYGPSDSGKTSMALDIIGYNMQKDPDFTAGWFETEGHFDVDYAIKTFGIDPDRFTIWNMNDYGAEKGLDVLESLLRSGAYNLVTVNTVAGLTPSKELTDSMEDNNIGLQARMMSKLMRKIVAISAKQNVHVLFINQVRASVGTYGTPDTPTGGKALSFWASQRVLMRSGFLDKDDKSKGYDPDRFKKIDCSVRKNRCAEGKNPYVKCTYYVEYGVGIDTVGQIPELAKGAGVITVRGAWHYDLDEKGNPIKLKNGSEGKWGSVGEFRTFLRNNSWYADELFDRIMASGAKVVDVMSEEEIDEVEEEEKELGKEFVEDTE